MRASRRDFMASCIHPWASRRLEGGLLKSTMASRSCCCSCWEEGGVVACSCIATYSRLRHWKDPLHSLIHDKQASAPPADFTCCMINKLHAPSLNCQPTTVAHF